MGERLLCKQEVTGSIPVFSIGSYEVRDKGEQGQAERDGKTIVSMRLMRKEIRVSGEGFFEALRRREV